MRIGTVCYATRQGLGYLARSFYDAGIVTDVMIFKHPHGDRPTQREWYPEGTIELTRRPFVGEAIERWLDDLDVVLFFETPFDWAFATRCRERGVMTAIMPMYEWFLQNPPHKFDLFLNPSQLDQRYFPQGTFLPVPAPQGVWRQRTKALKFLHNGGSLGCRGHKGTLELMKAMKYVKSPIELTIRSQNRRGLAQLIRQVPEIQNDKRVTFVGEDIPYENLFTGYDVMVAPEKFNGLSLPLQEACAAGLVVMTTDRFPANTWLPKAPLIPYKSVHQAQTMGGHLTFEEVVVDPVDIAASIDGIYGEDITYLSHRGKVYAENNSWEVLGPKYLKTIEEALKVYKGS